MLNITTTSLYRSALSVLTCLSLLSVLIIPIASASEQSEPTALVGGRLIDGFGNQPLANSVILVKNGLIEKVGTVDTLSYLRGTKLSQQKAWMYFQAFGKTMHT